MDFRSILILVTLLYTSDFCEAIKCVVCNSLVKDQGDCKDGLSGTARDKYTTDCETENVKKMCGGDCENPSEGGWFDTPEYINNAAVNTTAPNATEIYADTLEVKNLLGTNSSGYNACRKTTFKVTYKDKGGSNVFSTDDGVARTCGWASDGEAARKPTSTNNLLAASGGTDITEYVCKSKLCNGAGKVELNLLWMILFAKFVTSIYSSL